MSAQIPSATGSTTESTRNAMQSLESKAAETNNQKTLSTATNIMFVRGEVQGGAKPAGDGVVYNPDEIDIDMEDEEGSDDGAENEESDAKMKNVPIEKQVIPAKVFGSLKKNGSDSD